MQTESQPETPPPSMPRVAKVGHKKSRLGCQRCKTRRVKCDEQKPTCGNCRRHAVDCTYPDIRVPASSNDDSEAGSSRLRRTRVSLRRRKSPSPTADLFPRTLTEMEDPEIPESKARRLMELRLMQNNLLGVVAGPPSSARETDEWFQYWRVIVPALSLEHDNVLYASFALSATHLLRTNRSDEALYSARQNYLVLALREQRKECAEITDLNADAVCSTSVLILRNSFAMMYERSMENYEPPIEWLKMGRGAGAVMWKANAAVSTEEPASFKIFLDSYQSVLTEQAMQPELDPPFATVYAAICNERRDQGGREACRRTLAYINAMQRAISSDQPVYVVGRRLQAFPMVCPGRFVDYIEARDPYALVILAHYFGVAAQVDTEFWWLRGVGQQVEGTAGREIQAIEAVLDAEFQVLMVWPLSQIVIGET